MVLGILGEAPVAAHDSGHGSGCFIADAWDIIGRKVPRERLLADIYATVMGDLSGYLSDTIRMVRLVLSEGRNLIRQRDEIEARAVELLPDNPN